MKELRAIKIPLLQIIACGFLVFFAAIWLWIGWKVWQYEPTPTDKPRIEFSDPLVMTAGVLASAVAAGTAAILGIAIQRALKPSDGTFSARFNAGVSESPLIQLGVLAYLVVGVVVLIVWIANPNEAPDMVATFGAGALGWLAGAFSAVFRAPDT